MQGMQLQLSNNYKDKPTVMKFLGFLYVRGMFRIEHSPKKYKRIINQKI